MTYDVAARLDRGRPAVADTQAYVTACQAVGYAHPDLTAHGAQVLEWYDAEDGLDLDALDADCVALRTLADAADEALRVERDGLRVLVSAWSDESRSTAEGFIDRHCQSGATVVGALRTAADSCSALRDTLIGIVDDKVRAAIAIDDRRAAQRPAWLAAAQAVTTGSAGRDQAVDIVTGQITPYVDTDIRTEWVAAMRMATGTAQSAYRHAVQRIRDCRTGVFAVPDQIGPAFPATVTSVVSSPAAPVTVPAKAPAPVAPPPAVAPTEPALSPPPPDAQPVSPSLPTDPGALGAGTAPAPAIPSLPGAGLPGLGGGLGDTLGNLLPHTADVTGGPSPADPAPDRLDDADSPPDDPEKPDPQDDSTSNNAGEHNEDPQDEDQSDEDQPDGTAADEAATAEDPVAEEPDGEPASPPPAEVSPPSTPTEPADEPTPCEIAADELPQVGQ